jgi:hypothetical protein
MGALVRGADARYIARVQVDLGVGVSAVRGAVKGRRVGRVVAGRITAGGVTLRRVAVGRVAVGRTAGGRMAVRSGEWLPLLQQPVSGMPPLDVSVSGQSLLEESPS